MIAWMPGRNGRSSMKARTYLPGYGDGSGMITDVVWSGGALVASATCYDEIGGALAGDDELVAFARQHLPEIRTVDDVRVFIEDRLFRPGIQAILPRLGEVARVCPESPGMGKMMGLVLARGQELPDFTPNQYIGACRVPASLSGKGETDDHQEASREDQLSRPRCRT